MAKRRRGGERGAGREKRGEERGGEERRGQERGRIDLGPSLYLSALNEQILELSNY